MINGFEYLKQFTETVDLDKIKNDQNRTINETRINTAQVKIVSNFGMYKKGGKNPFDCLERIFIEFTKNRYQIYLPNIEKENSKPILLIEKKLNETVSEEEINKINKIWGETLLKHLETNRADLKKNK